MKPVCCREAVPLGDGPFAFTEASRLLLARSDLRRRLEQCRSGLGYRTHHDGPHLEGVGVELVSVHECTGMPAPPETGDDGFTDEEGRFVLFREVEPCR